MVKIDKKNECIEMLVLAAEKLGKPPKKSNFSGDEVIAIKREFGPWPRALETAGLKPVSPKRRKSRQYYHDKIRKAGQK